MWVCGFRMPIFSNTTLDEFAAHSTKMREAARARREAVRLRAVADADADAVAVSVWDTLGVRLPNDKWRGCTNLRTLRALLSIIDDRGFERSAHQVRRFRAPCPRCRLTPTRAQMKFHSAFERCVSRVVYKQVRRALTRTACNALTVRVASAGLGNEPPGHHAVRATRRTRACGCATYAWPLRAGTTAGRSAQVCRCPRIACHVATLHQRPPRCDR